MGKRIQQKGISILLMIVILLAAGSQLQAIATEPDSAMPSVDQQLLESKIKEAEASSRFDDITKGKLTELYRKSLTNLEKMRSYREEAAYFSSVRKTAPTDVEKLRSDLKEKEKIAVEKTLKISEKMPLFELEQHLNKEKADLAAVDAKLSDLSKQLEIQANRPVAARERLITAQRQQETIATDLKTVKPTDELAALSKARGFALETQAFAISAEIKMLDQELLSHQARVQLLEVKRDIAEHDVRFVETRVRILDDLLSQRRLSEADQAKQEAEATKEELKGKHPLIRELAEQNLVLGEELGTMALELERVSVLDDLARANAKRISGELSTIRQKLEIAGLSQALGQVLMQQRQTLPHMTNLSRESGLTERLIASSSLRQIQYSEKRRKLRDLNAHVTSLTKELPEQEASTLRIELEELVVKQRELLDKAIANEASYLRTLGELDLAQRQLIEVVESYDEFLGKRLLWIRSTDPVSLSLFKRLPGEVARLLSPAGWLTAGKDLLQQMTISPQTAIMILALVVLVSMRRRFVKYVVASGEMIGRIRSDRFSYTMEALGWTVLATAPLPLLLLTIGWQLSLVTETGEFTKAVGSGLINMSLNYLFLRFFADVCIPGGIVAKHFRWPTDIVTKLRHEFRLLMVLFLPCVFIVNQGLYLDGTGFGGGLTVLAVLTAVAATGLFLFRSFTPNGGVLVHFLARRPNSLLTRLRALWAGFLSVYIIGLMVLVFAGYLYTSGTLTRDLISTIWMIYLLVLARGLVMRWLLLVRRRLAYKVAVERRKEARAAREAEQKAGKGVHTSGEDDLLEIEEPEVDLAALDTDSRKLLDTAVLFASVIGLWLIWSPVLPAFGILDDVSIWSRTSIVDGVETVVPVTLADLALAIIIGIVTVAASKGLPAFLEFILLQRISITAGGRYTATTLLRYVIFGVGIVFFFTILGGSWSKIQWLVAALSLGIGFGLQEIVANFISGLIILFERPIRVGDTVTVGDTSGVVSRINIRATTIINWDRQELLVPNKEFITTKLLNWSLSDPIIRIQIPVGIAYGSDAAKAMLLMKEAAEEHPNVIEEPAASVAFESFGDNALQLVLRVFLPSIEERVRTITELHMAINNKFNEAGIVIAFPQRDIHLDTSQPIDVRLQREQDTKHDGE